MMNDLRKLLEESHKDLHQWFLFYQECVLIDEAQYANRCLVIFKKILLFHLQFEEQYLLNEHLQQLKWPVKVYRLEHKKLSSKLDSLFDLTKTYFNLSGRKKRLALLTLIEYQLQFYRLMEHHEQREEKDLFFYIPNNVDKTLWLLPYQEITETIFKFKAHLKNVLIQ